MNDGDTKITPAQVKMIRSLAHGRRRLGWVAWAAWHGAWSQVPMWLVFTATAWWGWRKWGRAWGE